MSIDIRSEEILSLTEATKLLPKRRAGKRVHVATLHRWITTGVRGVILEHIVIGGCRCVSVESLQRFFDALTAQAQAKHGQIPKLLPKHISAERRRKIENAKKRLARAGV